MNLVPGDRVRFDRKATSWLVRAVSENRRYTLLTASMFGQVYYSIIDHDLNIRGPLNVIGQGMGIFTTSGPDPAIDETMMMLRPYPEGYFDDGPQPVDVDNLYGYEVSHRNRVSVNITEWRKEDDTTWTRSSDA